MRPRGFPQVGRQCPPFLQLQMEVTKNECSDYMARN